MPLARGIFRLKFGVDKKDYQRSKTALGRSETVAYRPEADKRGSEKQSSPPQSGTQAEVMDFLHRFPVSLDRNPS